MDALKERDGAVAVEQIEFVKVKVALAERALDVLALAEEVVVDAVDLVALAEEAREEVRGDEAGRAGDDDLHFPSSAARVRASSSGVPMSKKSWSTTSAASLRSRASVGKTFSSYEPRSGSRSKMLASISEKPASMYGSSGARLSKRTTRSPSMAVLPTLMRW